MAYPAFQTLYGEHHRWLVSWLRGKVGNTFDAADLAQDTFLRLLTRSPAAPLIEPRAFLSTVAHGLVVDLWRRRDLEQAYLTALARLADHEAPSPEARQHWLDLLVNVDRLLAGVPNRARKAFLMARLEGLTCPQIATQLGISLATVERDLARALRQIYTVRFGS